MKILVVDDHPLFLDGLQQVLRLLDDTVTVVQAIDAEEALTHLTPNNDIDLIMVDLNMPGINGIDLLTTLVAREIWTPAVVISAHDDPSSVIQALDAGALAFIPKSFNADELITALRVVLKGGVYLPETMMAQIKHMRRTTGKTQPATENIGDTYGITSRQFRVLELLVKGHSNKQIALILNLTENTVKSHLKSLFAALNTRNRTACVQKAEKLGLVKQPAADFGLEGD